MADAEKKTFLERVFGSFFSAQERDYKGFILVILVMYSVWITHKYVDQNDTMNERIVEEVRRQVHPAITQELEPLQKRVDTTTKVVKDVSSNIEKFIKKHD